MTELKEYREFIESNFDVLEAPSNYDKLYEPIRYFLGIGGKRIRPILTLLGAELFGVSKEQALYPALAIEIFHNFTLVHDDIMDDAPLRRNMETIHTKWDDRVGLIVGDVMLLQSYQLLNKIEGAPLEKVLQLFDKTAIEVCEGQQSDINFEKRDDVSTEEYLEMIRLKTSVLIGAAVAIGAIVGGANKEDTDALYAFGLHIGLAFQIQDDILDLYADPDKFGKQVGGDVIANKKTLLHLTAVSKASYDQLVELNSLQEEKNLTFKVERTREIFNDLGVRELCEQRMEDHYTTAMSALETVHTSEESKVPLKKLARYLLERDL